MESFAVSFCSLNFIGAVRFVFSSSIQDDRWLTSLTLRSAFFLGLLAGGPAAVWCIWRKTCSISNYSNELHSVPQVKLPHNHGVHVHHRRRPCRDLLCVAPQWLNLHMGRRKRRTKTCPIFRVSRRLVVNHSLDDIHGRKLSSKLRDHHSPRPLPESAAILTRVRLGNSKLHRITARRMGG